MTDGRRLTRELSGFARALAAGSDVCDVLLDLAERLTDLLGLDGADVCLKEGETVRFAIGDNAALAALGRGQERLQSGPCITAIGSGRPVVVADLADGAGRWPAFAADAAELGVRSVAAVPMGDGAILGAAALYRADAHQWTDDELETALVFTDIAAAFLHASAALDRQRRTAEQLQRALDSRIVIEQAKGILAAHHQITVDQAFVLLRKHANDRNATLRAVSEAVVNLGLRP